MTAGAEQGEVQWVRSARGAAQLAERILDRDRLRVIVGVSMPAYLSAPLLNAGALAQELGVRGEVWVMADYRLAKALAKALPNRLDVMGGAVRLWWPIPDAQNPEPSRHPKYRLYCPQDGVDVAQQITAAVAGAADRLHEPGTTARGQITAVKRGGADLTLDSGVLAHASIQHLTRHAKITDAREVLAVGQSVRVKLGRPARGEERMLVSMRPFSLEPWAELARRYHPGDIIQGRITEIQQAWALVELLPGATGLLHASQLTTGYVNDAADHLSLGEWVTVRLIRLSESERRAELTQTGIGAHEPIHHTPAIHERGPAWSPAA